MLRFNDSEMNRVKAMLRKRSDSFSLTTTLLKLDLVSRCDATILLPFKDELILVTRIGNVEAGKIALHLCLRLISLTADTSRELELELIAFKQRVLLRYVNMLTECSDAATANVLAG